MANAYFYSNIATPTTLSGNINNLVGSCTVADTTGWPSSFPYVVALDYNTANEELVKVTANAAGTLTITRAFGSTTAVSHSSGAVVRHVLNAVDFTDFRTHEAATSAVHGITGSFVGTTDTQTLTNKTLTSPTINSGTLASGAMSGTFTGTPTFSGAVVLSGTPSISTGAALAGTFTGTPTFSGNTTFSGSVTAMTVSGEIALSNLLRGTRALATDSQYEARVTGDANARWFVRTDGNMRWGPGTTTFDTTLYRSAANILGTDASFRVEPTNTALDGLMANLPTATTGDLLNLRVNAAIQAAMGSDGAFRIYGGNAPTTYTPTVGNGGTVTWTTRTGYYWKLGKMVYVTIQLTVNVAGSGTGIVTVDMPSSVDRTTRQALTMHTESTGPTSSHIGGGECVFFVGGTGATADRLRTDEGSATGREANITGADLLAGGIIVIQGWYREA